jgi:hypothetical protein
MASQDVGTCVGAAVVGEMVGLCVALVGVSVRGAEGEKVGMDVSSVAVGLVVVEVTVDPLVVGLSVGMPVPQHSEHEQPCATVSAHVQPNKRTRLHVQVHVAPQPGGLQGRSSHCCVGASVGLFVVGETVVGVAVVGTVVGLFVVGPLVGLVVGLFVVGETVVGETVVGVAVGLVVVGETVAGGGVGLFDAGLLVGFLVGLPVVGEGIVGETVGLAVVGLLVGVKVQQQVQFKQMVS